MVANSVGGTRRPLPVFLILGFLALALGLALVSARGGSPPDPTGPTVLPAYIAALHSLRARLAASAAAGPLVLEGHSGQVLEQTVYYATVLARERWIRRVCETGFNAGHSAVNFLSSNPDVHLYAFDLLGHNYSQAALEAVSALFPGRLHVTGGDSSVTLPAFAAEHGGGLCDFVSVDGGHWYEAAISDLRNFRKMAAPRNLVVIDDVACGQNYCEGPKLAWEQAKREGLIRELECYSLESGNRGFCIGRYIV
ncbi:hypothetical protein DFJ74DRAFT_708559 [Hyaloraphidium curvatum]|nr:hypothetical protein DFJ74DRAFT_708559 [Hyaloraphidium curvatum]